MLLGSIKSKKPHSINAPQLMHHSDVPPPLADDPPDDYDMLQLLDEELDALAPHVAPRPARGGAWSGRILHCGTAHHWSLEHSGSDGASGGDVRQLAMGQRVPLG